MTDALVVVSLGFVLGMRHATDADHVIAVTTIVSRRRDLIGAATTGLAWGVGHSLTVMAVGSAIIFFNLVVPPRVGLGMELSVGAMLVVLGGLNVASYVKYVRAARRQPGESGRMHSHAHSHGDYVHSHPHRHEPDAHPHRPDRTPLAAIDRRFTRSRVYAFLRPMVVGVVHGLAGSAAVTLLVVAAVREPRWAVAYLLVFGVGTIVGMMLITMSLASAFRLAGVRSDRVTRRFGFACGIVSVVFGLSFAYHVWSGSGAF